MARGRVLACMSRPVTGLAYSPDGGYPRQRVLLAVGVVDLEGKSHVSLLELPSGRCRARVPGPFHSLAWQPKGRVLAAAGFSHAFLIDPSTGSVRKRLAAGVGFLYALAWSTGGELAGGTEDGSLLSWEGATGNLRARLPAHSGHIHALAWDPEGTHVAVFGHGELRVWNVVAKREVRASEDSQVFAGCLARSPDGSRFALAGGHELRLHPAWSGGARTVPPAEQRGSGAGITTLAWSPDGDWLVTGETDGRIRFRDPVAGVVLYRLGE